MLKLLTLNSSNNGQFDNKEQTKLCIKARDVEQFCRICFQSTSELVSCFTKIITEDVSYSIIEILNLISSHQGVIDPDFYPKGICSACKELINAVIQVKVKYEKTSQLLKTWFLSYTKLKEHCAKNLTDDEDDDNQMDEFTQNNEDAALVKPSSTSETLCPNFENNIEQTGVKYTNKVSTTNIQDSKNVRLKENKIVKVTSAEKKRTCHSIVQTNHTHICPFCMTNLPNALEVKKHALSHKTLRKYLKGEKMPKNAKFIATPRKTETIFSKSSILHKCVYCMEELPVRFFLRHIMKHKQTEFRCNKCDRIFRKQNHLNSHITYSHLEEFPYQCNQCDKGFVIKENYDAHLLTHIKPNVLPYKCDKCNQSFTNKKHLYYHSFKHTEIGSFAAKYKTHKCKICLRTFENADCLQEHRVQAHNKQRSNIKIKMNGDGLYECELCSKTYNNAVALKQHLRQTHRPKNLCSLCGASVLNLKQHMISHEEKKDPLECHICHRLLASKLTLSRHIRVHTGEKPYKCSFCDKTFKDHYPMRVHERIHKGDKKHVCTVCGKGFLEKSYMLKHFRNVHSK